MTSGSTSHVRSVSVSPGSQRLLVVDDDDAVRQVTAEMLAALGYASDTVSSGHKALQQLSEAHYDLMLLDVAMPTMSGAEVVAELDNRALDIPVILMTGFSVSEVADLMASSSTPRAVLSKPFPMKELRAAVESMFV
ncbi:MAG: response regulator [Pseudomonadales bacterium]